MLFASCILLALPAGLAAAQGTGPTIEARTGFDGYCRTAPGGQWCPLYIVLANEGADVIGELRISYGGPPGEERDFYALEVMLPAHSRKAYFLSIPSDNGPSRVVVHLLGKPGQSLGAEWTAVTWLKEDDRLYAVASSDPTALGFLSDVAPAGGKAAVAHVSLETLPPDPLAWDALDVLIVNDVDAAALSREQRRALEVWLSQGGHLIVGGGASAARIQPLADLLPVTVGGTRLLDNLSALGEPFGGAAAAPGPYPVAESTLREGKTIIAQGESDPVILWARRSHGAGTVDFLAFDAGLNPFARWEDAQALWRLIAETNTGQKFRVVVRQGSTARDAVNTIPGMSVPSTLQIIGFMLIYIVLVGPVNYLILKKMDRRELAWLTIPALILTFTACAYMTGFQIRGAQAIVHQLSVVYVPEGADVGRVNSAVGVFSPRRAIYDVRTSGARARALPEDYYGGGGTRPLHFYEETEGTRIRDLRVDIGGVRPFLAEQYVDAPDIEANLRVVVGQASNLSLEGKIRIGATPLKNAVLLAGNQDQRLGDLAAGAEANINIPYAYHGYVSAAGLPDRILGVVGYYGGNSDLSRQYRFLQAIFPYDGGGLGNGVYLLGWSDEPVLSVEVEKRPYRTLATTLYIYALPVRSLKGGTQIEIPPSLIPWRVEKTDGNVNFWSESINIGGNSQAILRFSVWKEVMVAQVDRVILDLQGTHTNQMPKISLWNARHSTWDTLDISDWGAYTVPNGADYIIPPGDILLRMETGEADWANVTIAAITIKGRK